MFVLLTFLTNRKRKAFQEHEKVANLFFIFTLWKWRLKHTWIVTFDAWCFDTVSCVEIETILKSWMFAEQLVISLVFEANGLCVDSANTRLCALSWMETVFKLMKPETHMQTTKIVHLWLEFMYSHAKNVIKVMHKSQYVIKKIVSTDRRIRSNEYFLIH